AAVIGPGGIDMPPSVGTGRPHTDGENAAAATRYLPEAQPVCCWYVTFHQPAAGVVDGPPITSTVAPHGMAVRMLALVPTPSRRLSESAITRAWPPMVMTAPPSPDAGAPPSPFSSMGGRPRLPSAALPGSPSSWLGAWPQPSAKHASKASR